MVHVMLLDIERILIHRSRPGVGVIDWDGRGMVVIDLDRCGVVVIDRDGRGVVEIDGHGRSVVVIGLDGPLRRRRLGDCKVDARMMRPYVMKETLCAGESRRADTAHAGRMAQHIAVTLRPG